VSTHERFDRKHEVKTSSDRAFGVVFAVVFALVGLAPAIDGGGVRWWAVALAGVLAVVTGVAPRLLAPANRLWSRIGLLLHRVVSPLVTGFLFFAVVTPTGLIMRALGKDPLRLKFDRGAPSYWIERAPPGPEPSSMSNQF